MKVLRLLYSQLGKDILSNFDYVRLCFAQRAYIHVSMIHNKRLCKGSHGQREFGKRAELVRMKILRLLYNQLGKDILSNFDYARLCFA